MLTGLATQHVLDIPRRGGKGNPGGEVPLPPLVMMYIATLVPVFHNSKWEL